MPHGIWKIDGRDVVHLRPDPGGVLFTRFVGDILQPSAHLNGIAASALHFNLRTNKPDGAVDTAVDGALMIEMCGASARRLGSSRAQTRGTSSRRIWSRKSRKTMRRN